jgi:hypothetical protein
MRRGGRIDSVSLHAYSAPAKRTELFLAVGEVHKHRTFGPVARPTWLTIPERGLFTGICVLGAIGSGKTSC